MLVATKQKIVDLAQAQWPEDWHCHRHQPEDCWQRPGEVCYRWDKQRGRKVGLLVNKEQVEEIIERPRLGTSIKQTVDPNLVKPNVLWQEPRI